MTDLARLLQPRSIAVVGGGAWGASVVEQCRKTGFAGAVWPVHPHRDELGGAATVPSVTDLPAAPDAVFIGVNRHTTIEVVRQLRDMGAGGAVCFASGFREAQAETGDGDSLQAALLAAAGEMPVIGPNCYGFINYLDGALLWPDQHGGQRAERGVAVLTQSSNMAINVTMQRRGLPLAYVATAGNQAQTGLAEIGTALLEDDRVTRDGPRPAHRGGGRSARLRGDGGPRPRARQTGGGAQGRAVGAGAGGGRVAHGIAHGQ
jgi:acyl-CoA synthetase (NDP forming)